MARTTDKYGINEEKPTFFKRIAPHVLKHDGNVQPERAVLTWNSSVDCSWTVKVSRTEEGVYFKDGWKEFLNDNSVKEGNFLVFTYEGDMHFSIRYFDKISFNRGDIPTNEAHEESAPAKITKRNPGRPRKHFSAESAVVKSTKHRGRPRTDVSADIILKSKFPHYTKAIKHTFCVYSMPTSFYREHLSAGNYEFALLQISGGNKWYKVKLVPSNQTAFMSKGWRTFARDNQIVVGDICAFELVEKNKMVVHILQN